MFLLLFKTIESIPIGYKLHLAGVGVLYFAKGGLGEFWSEGRDDMEYLLNTQLWLDMEGYIV